MKLERYQERNREYNMLQLVKSGVGSPLKTLKGSVVRRSKFGVGKSIGGKFYFHKDYANLVLPEQLQGWYFKNKIRVPFHFNCLRYNPQSEIVEFVECPDFDNAREPIVGRICTITSKGEVKVSRFYNHVYHHKWTFVSDNYKGFDVRKSWEWSREWLSSLTEPANGSNIENWVTQLKKFELA